MKRMILDYDYCANELKANLRDDMWASDGTVRLYVVTKFNPPSTYANVSYRVTVRRDSEGEEVQAYAGESLREAIDSFNINTEAS